MVYTDQAIAFHAHITVLHLDDRDLPSIDPGSNTNIITCKSIDNENIERSNLAPSALLREITRLQIACFSLLSSQNIGIGQSWMAVQARRPGQFNTLINRSEQWKNSTTTMKAIFLLLLLPLQLFSQDLSGIWVGTISTSQTQMPLELAINQDMTGYSMITFMYKGAEKIAVKKITLNRKDSVFTISDDKLVYNNFTTRSRSIKTFCELSIKMVDTIMVLSGPFHTRTRDLREGDQDLSTGTITLRKQNRQAQTRLITKLDSLKLSNTLVFSNPEATTKESPVVAVSEKETPVVAVPEKEAAAVTRNPAKDLSTVKVQQHVRFENTASAIPDNQKIIKAAAEVALRKTEAIRTIDFKSDSLVLVLYDNGIVDGDTVSVLLNDEVIIPKQGLTEQAYRKVIKIPAGMGDSLQLVIYAENLGSIPPNSGLLIIEDGSDRYEVGFKGDMTKSPAVILRRKG